MRLLARRLLPSTVVALALAVPAVAPAAPIDQQTVVMRSGRAAFAVVSYDANRDGSIEGQFTVGLVVPPIASSVGLATGAGMIATERVPGLADLSKPWVAFTYQKFEGPDAEARTVCRVVKNPAASTWTLSDSERVSTASFSMPCHDLGQTTTYTVSWSRNESTAGYHRAFGQSAWPYGFGDRSGASYGIGIHGNLGYADARVCWGTRCYSAQTQDFWRLFESTAFSLIER